MAASSGTAATAKENARRSMPCGHSNRERVMGVTTEESISTLIKSLSGEIRRTLKRPIYIQITQESGEASIKQIEFLTPEQLAELMHVETRTVYSWVEKAQENGLKFYRAPNTRGVLFEINEVLEWIKKAV
jgi:excisionase family DNA binding protein